MKLPSLSLSFGRRMLALLLLCIAMPAASFGCLSLLRVEDRLRRNTLRGMRSGGGKIALTAYDAFPSAAVQTEFLAGVPASPKTGRTLTAPDMGSTCADRFAVGATRILDGSRTEPLSGDPCPPPEREFLVCEVNAGLLWERIRDVIPPDTEAAVLYRKEGVRFRSKPYPSVLLDRTGQREKTDAAGDFEWGLNEEAQLVDFVPVFLKATFFDSGCIVVIARPRAEAFAYGSRSLFFGV